jgi:hypothetical protein
VGFGTIKKEYESNISFEDISEIKSIDSESREGSALYGFQWVNNTADKTWQELNNRGQTRAVKVVLYLAYRLVTIIAIPSNSISCIISLVAKILVSPFTYKSAEDSRARQWHAYFQDCKDYSWDRIKQQISCPFEIDKIVRAL